MDNVLQLAGVTLVFQLKDCDTQTKVHCNGKALDFLASSTAIRGLLLEHEGEKKIETALLREVCPLHAYKHLLSFANGYRVINKKNCDYLDEVNSVLNIDILSKEIKKYQFHEQCRKCLKPLDDECNLFVWKKKFGATHEMHKEFEAFEEEGYTFLGPESTGKFYCGSLVILVMYFRKPNFERVKEVFPDEETANAVLKEYMV